jgi:hypothetical protein
MQTTSKPKQRLPVSIPAALHRRFKIHCATEGLLMSEVLVELLEQYEARVRAAKLLEQDIPAPSKAGRLRKPTTMQAAE